MGIDANATPNATAAQGTLASLSTVAAQSYGSTQALVTAVLALISEQLGMRTSFLTEITTGTECNHIAAAYNQENGCGLASGVDLPLSETFCSIIAKGTPPAPLIIEHVAADALFGAHPAARASPNIGAFVGVPLLLRSGELYGTLCAIDPEPQRISSAQTDLLIVLARLIATQLDHDRDHAALLALANERDRLYDTAQETLREREALVAIASHELKNPLTALLGQAQLLQRRMLHNTASTAQEQQHVARVIQQAQRLNAMLTDLLDVSRLDHEHIPLQCTAVDIGAIVHHVFEEMATIDTEHRVTFHEPDEVIMVHGDAGRLEQVVRNLLGNALKYTPRGGQVTIALMADSATAYVEVRDTGIGVPADALPKLFRRFYRVDQPQDVSVKGFGIGLYVVKEIVTQHGGDITVTSTPGNGSVFTVRLPRVNQQEEAYRCP